MVKSNAVFLSILLAACGMAATLRAEDRQLVEGFGSIVFSHGGGAVRTGMDFLGPSKGFLTGDWSVPHQVKNNRVVWKTAICPEKKPTTFAFVGASSVTPSEFSRGPKATLYVNGGAAVTFELGVTRDRVWKQGGYELRYEAKRVEWPYWGSNRFSELNGNSGIYQLAVPQSDVTAGESVTLKVEVSPFPRWSRGWFMVKERRRVLVEDERTLAAEVRQLQRDIRKLGEQTHVLATQVYSDLVDSREFDHFLIYTSGYQSLLSPDTIRLQNGDLLLTVREGAEHVSRDGDMIMLRSQDNGRTWGERQVLAGEKEFDEREAAGVQLRDGTIVVGVFYNELYREDGRYLRTWRSTMQFGQGKRYLGTFVITSNDNGRTWSERRFIDTQGMPFTDTEGPADAPIEMPDGSILMPLMAYNVRGDMANKAAVVLKSTDKGNTWKHLSIIAEDPGGKLGEFQEPALVRTRTGRLIAALRNQGPDNAIWTTYSDDEGKTWKPVQQSPMVGHPADLVELPDGRVLCTYGSRSGRHSDPGGIRATFSKDGGETWQTDREVQIRKDFLNFDIGYPESIPLADGRLLTVYYFNLFNRFFVGGTFWKP